MEVEALVSPDAPDAVFSEWDALHGGCALASPFQSPRWLAPWWRHLGEGTPFIVTIRRSGSLAGVAPLYLEDGVVYCMGRHATDYMGLLADGSVAGDAATAFFEFLACSNTAWKRCVFEELPWGSPLLRAEAPQGLRFKTAEGESCPYLDLPDSVEALRSMYGPDKATGSGRIWLKAEREGALRAEKADLSSLGDFMDDFFRLHSARWAAAGQSGVLANERLRAFHDEASWMLVEKGMLWPMRLIYRGRTAAALYTLAGPGAIYFYLGGFAPDLAEISPGKLLIYYTLEDAVRAGLKRADFLRGRERYKAQWCNGERRNSTLMVEHG